MPVVEAAIKRGDTAAVAALGEKLFTRHGPFHNWGDLWWNAVVKAIWAAPSQVSSNSLVDTALVHIFSVDDKVGCLDGTVSRWLDTLSPASKVDSLGQRSSPFLTILLNLVTSRRISSLTILEKLVFPIWQTTSSACLVSRARQSSKSQAAVENSVMLAHQLLVSIGPHRHLPPATLGEAFILFSARARVLHDTNVPSLIRHLPFLVVLQYSPSISSKTREYIATLLESLAATAEFKTAAFRHLEILKDAFLSSEWSKPSLDPGLETGMVDTLKLIMSESTGHDHKSTPPLLPVDSASRFSAWRWTGIVLGLRVEFKTLAGRIEGNDRPAEAKETLALLVRQSLERDTSADDADLLCEAFRGIEPVVIQEVSPQPELGLTADHFRWTGPPFHSPEPDAQRRVAAPARIDRQDDRPGTSHHYLFDWRTRIY
jgi:mediator of RNA polymerase II transcription subunit 12